ncbi:MAG: preprotein translocase subunit YajC [Clostridia bacterium]|nr:preprotein translocase subunit YajC [Clostridia bacterium]
MPMDQFVAQYGMWIYLIFIIAIFYFILIRPQRKKDKEHKNMISSLKKGDQILTIGGFYAKVVSLKDDALTVMLGDTKVKIELGAVKTVIKSNNNAEAALEEETNEETAE